LFLDIGRNLFFTPSSKPILRPLQPPVPWQDTGGSLLPDKKRPDRKSHRSLLLCAAVMNSFNSSAWSDEHCSSCCTLSLIRQYLDNLRSKCSQAVSRLFVKELALLWCGRELLEIISSFFLCSRNLGFLFAVPNFTDGFMRPTNSEMKRIANVIAIVTYLRYVALKWCMTSPSYIKGLFVSSLLFAVCISFEAAVRCSDGVE